MIKLVQKRKKRKANKKPYYTLEYRYMIGDANGNTSETVKLSADNPFIERYVKLLNGLKPNKQSWGVQLNDEDLDGFYSESQITLDDLRFLRRLMFEEYDIYEENDEVEGYTYPIEKDNLKFAREFYSGVRDESEYSFLVFEEAVLKYSNEYGEKFDTKIV